MTSAHATYAAYAANIDRLARMFIHRFAPLADADTKADMLQAARLAGYLAITTHDPTRCKLTTYLFLRVQGSVIDYVRASRCPKRQRMDPGLDADRLPATGCLDTVAEAHRVLARVQSHEADMATVLVRHYVGGESVDEIAHERGQSRSWLWRCMSRQRDALAARCR